MDHRLFHLLHFPGRLHDRYTELVLADTLRMLALAFVSFFVPVFLLKNGYSLFAIAFYQIGAFALVIFLHYYILRRIHRIGLRRTFVLSYLASIIYFLVLYRIGVIAPVIGSGATLAVLASLNAAALALYWSAHHVYFLRSTDNGNAGTKAGQLFAITGIISMAGLYAGSIMITGLGFDLVFLIVIVLLLAASAALSFASPLEIEPSTFTFAEVIDRTRMRKNLIYFIQGVNNGTIAFAWPLYLFVSSVALVTIGGIYLVADLAFYLVGLFTSRQADRGHTGRIVAIGALLHGVTIIARGFISGVSAIAFWQLTAGISGGMLHETLEAEFFKHAGAHHRAAAMNRELYMHLGRILAVLVFIILLATLPQRLAFTFTLVLGGLVTMSLPVITQKRKSM